MLRNHLLLRLLLLLLVATLAPVYCQIPAFGGCPNYPPMTDFDKDQFLGKWYELERLFTVTELAAKCVVANYEKRPDGKIWVDNLITSRLTGVQRKVSGIVTMASKTGEAKFSVKYNTLPISYDTIMNVLDTDYTNFAVVYSCSQLGSLGHTQSVWLMSRERIPPGPTLQRAYGVLDKYKINRTFFIKTDQNDCEIVAPPQEIVDHVDEVEEDKPTDSEDYVVTATETGSD